MRTSKDAALSADVIVHKFRVDVDAQHHDRRHHERQHQHEHTSNDADTTTTITTPTRSPTIKADAGDPLTPLGARPRASSRRPHVRAPTPPNAPQRATCPAPPDAEAYYMYVQASPISSDVLQ